ncbi:MAG: Hpt domain-containing protein [Fibrobacteria bacterium]|nr:Hpt domain-containing protein [Fibrobacteria bacterium]
MDPNIPVVDRDGAMERLDGDEELWGEIRSIWIEDSPQMLSAVLVASSGRSSDGLRRAAHALKGASSNVGATRVAEAARLLEAAAPSEAWETLDLQVESLRREVDAAKSALMALEAA